MDLTNRRLQVRSMVEARTIQLHVGCVLLDATVFRSHAAAMHAEEIIEHVHDATKAAIHRQMLRWFVILLTIVCVNDLPAEVLCYRKPLLSCSSIITFRVKAWFRLKNGQSYGRLMYSRDRALRFM